MRASKNTRSIFDILTKNDQETDENGRQCAHAKLERLSFLNQFAVLAPETVRTDASVTESRILIDASATVQAGIVNALILVHASFVVRRRDPSLSATATNNRNRLM